MLYCITQHLYRSYNSSTLNIYTRLNTIILLKIPFSSQTHIIYQLIIINIQIYFKTYSIIYHTIYIYTTIYTAYHIPYYILYTIYHTIHIIHTIIIHTLLIHIYHYTILYTLLPGTYYHIYYI
mgnify:CR=1 FL=1